jgi:hypothetical protein
MTKNRGEQNTANRQQATSKKDKTIRSVAMKKLSSIICQFLLSQTRYSISRLTGKKKGDKDGHRNAKVLKSSTRTFTAFIYCIVAYSEVDWAPLNTYERKSLTQ